MTNAHRSAALASSILIAAIAGSAMGQDWPQWRGSDQQAKVAGFTAPAAWPKTLAEKWKTTVGDGAATPALVGDKLYVFARQNNNEVISCLDAASGKEVWHDQYPAAGVTGAASGFPGPRSSPAVGDGKVVTLGVHGMLSCHDAATGKKLWQTDSYKAGEPQFSVATSPIVVGGLCIAQVGGGMVALDLTTGEAKWKWTGDGPAYASPSLMTVGTAKLVVAETAKKIVAINFADGKQVWETAFAAQGMSGYNACSPIADGQTLIYSGGGRGTHAVKMEQTGDTFTAKELWSNAKTNVMFNSPVVKDGFIYGLSQANDLFCINEQTGVTAWTSAASPAASPGQPAPGGMPAGGGGGRRGGGGMGGGRGGGGYGSIIDAGTVLLALTPKSEIVAFQPTDKAFTEVARIKVAASPTYAYPVLSGNRVFIKDQDSVALLAIE